MVSNFLLKKCLPKYTRDSHWCLMKVVGYQSQAASGQKPVASGQKPVARSQKPAASGKQPVASGQRPAAIRSASHLHNYKTYIFS
jgi:hypothetical protein